MRRLTLTVGTGLLMSSLAMAQPTPQPEQRGPQGPQAERGRRGPGNRIPGMNRERLARLFDHLDVDKDGKIDREEFAKQIPGVIQRLRDRVGLGRGPGRPGRAIGQPGRRGMGRGPGAWGPPGDDQPKGPRWRDRRRDRSQYDGPGVDRPRGPRRDAERGAGPYAFRGMRGRPGWGRGGPGPQGFQDGRGPGVERPGMKRGSDEWMGPRPGGRRWDGDGQPRRWAERRGGMGRWGAPHPGWGRPDDAGRWGYRPPRWDERGDGERWNDGPPRRGWGRRWQDRPFGPGRPF